MIIIFTFIPLNHKICATGPVSGTYVYHKVCVSHAVFRDILLSVSITFPSCIFPLRSLPLHPLMSLPTRSLFGTSSTGWFRFLFNNRLYKNTPIPTNIAPKTPKHVPMVIDEIATNINNVKWYKTQMLTLCSKHNKSFRNTFVSKSPLPHAKWYLTYILDFL